MFQFDFIDESLLKHPELTEPICLANVNTTQKIKKGKANYCETVFFSQLNPKRSSSGGTTRYMFFLSLKDGSRSDDRALLV